MAPPGAAPSGPWRRAGRRGRAPRARSTRAGRQVEHRGRSRRLAGRSGPRVSLPLPAPSVPSPWRIIWSGGDSEVERAGVAARWKRCCGLLTVGAFNVDEPLCRQISTSRAEAAKSLTCARYRWWWPRVRLTGAMAAMGDPARRGAGQAFVGRDREVAELVAGL